MSRNFKELHLAWIWYPTGAWFQIWSLFFVSCCIFSSQSFKLRNKKATYCVRFSDTASTSTLTEENFCWRNFCGFWPYPRNSPILTLSSAKLEFKRFELGKDKKKREKDIGKKKLYLTHDDMTHLIYICTSLSGKRVVLDKTSEGIRKTSVIESLTWYLKITQTSCVREML